MGRSMRPPQYQQPFDLRPARGFLLRVGILIVLLIAAFQSISFYVESLWFGSLGFEAVYWYRLQAQAAVFFAFTIATAFSLFVLFRVVMPPAGYSRRPFIQQRLEHLHTFSEQRPHICCLGPNLWTPVVVLHVHPAGAGVHLELVS